MHLYSLIIIKSIILMQGGQVPKFELGSFSPLCSSTQTGGGS